MNLDQRLELSYYKTITVIDEAHKIYLVQHRETNKIYIKKILDVYNRSIYEQLQEHPISGTPRIIARYEEEDRLTIIEEYISGTSLEEKIRDIASAEKSAALRHVIIQYMTYLCGILWQLHSLNPPIVHRDIKPSNIIVTNDDHVMLLDFNAAKYFTNAEKGDTVLLGTQGYAAPEQYGFGSSSPQTDIYSMGITLREMLQAAGIDDPSLNAIVDKCTQLNPADRYENAMLLQKALLRNEAEYSALQVPKPVEMQHPTQTVASSSASGRQTGSAGLIPPGFRTGKKWKMCIAVPIYLLILYFIATLEIQGVHGGAEILERFCILIITLSIIAVLFNYLNIQRLMPLCRSRHLILRILGMALMIFIILIVVVTLMVIVESIFFPDALVSTQA